jgi:hypothetical protein
LPFFEICLLNYSIPCLYTQTVGQVEQGENWKDVIKPSFDRCSSYCTHTHRFDYLCNANAPRLFIVWDDTKMNTCTFAEAEADARVDGDTTPQLSPSGTNETSDSRLRTPDDQARRQRQSNGRSHSLDHSRSLPLGVSDLKKAPTRRSLGWIPGLSVPSGFSVPRAADCTLPPIIDSSTKRNSRHETTSQFSPLLSLAHLASQTDRQGDYANQIDRHTSRRDTARTAGARSEGIEDELRRSTKVIPEAREPVRSLTLLLDTKLTYRLSRDITSSLPMGTTFM